MSKIFANVYLPASGKNYDVKLPLDSRVGELIPLLEAMMEVQAEGYYISDSETVLCDRATGEVLDVNQTIYDLGYQNGAELMMI